MDGVKERPILFSAPMVRALLDGRKTQTRRVLKLQPHHVDGGVPFGDPPAWAIRDGAAAGSAVMRCPYGKRGDRLWVRETWGYRGARYDSDTPDLQDIYIRYRADDPQPTLARSITCRRGEHANHLGQQRAQRDNESRDDFEDYLLKWWRRWRPAIHMPRWASRINLEITGVRVERLQSISEADAIAEGIERTGHGWRNYLVAAEVPTHWDSPVDSYRTLWDSINGAGAWGASPWVWAVSFKLVKP